jgi:hypothetical protein
MSNEGVRGGNVMKNESDINYVKAARIGIRFDRPFKGLKLTSDKVELSNQNLVDKIIKKNRFFFC